MKECLEKLFFVKESDLDGRDYYVFQNEEGKLRIAKATDYRSYKLSPGNSLLARIQGKGCAGQEIIELLHPYYREESVYSFVVVRSGSFILNDERITFIVIKDNAGNEFKTRNTTQQTFKSGEIIQCKLTGQRNGKLKFSII